MNYKIWRGYTLIELIISFAILFILFSSAFVLIWITISHEEKNKTILEINNYILTNKEFEGIANKEIAFYSYQSLENQIQTKSDFENQYRKDLKEIITSWMNKISKNEPFSLKSPKSCEILVPDLMEHEEEKYINEYKLNDCNNDIDSQYFKSHFNILSIVDKKNLDVSIYFIYKFHLYRIKTKLNTDLTKDNIIYKDFESNKFIKIDFFRKDLLFTKFFWNSNNKCWDTECIFKDSFSKKDWFPWYIDYEIIKLKIWNDDRYDFNSSYIIKNIKNLNISHE